MLLTSLALSAIVPLFPATPAAAGGPVCDPGPRVYVVECNGPITMVQLDATGSTGTGTLSYSWVEECPNAMFDDPTSPTPILSIDLQGQCSNECGGIRLTVTDSTGSSTCNTAVFVQDTTPPDITCPADVTVLEGAPTDPAATGMASASDTCNSTPTVTFSDVVTPDNDPSTPLVETITRTWTADDGCYTATCDQVIYVEAEEPPMEDPYLDIKPGSCPNPINVNSGGVLPVALVGSVGFDVRDVDPSTLVLRRSDGVGGSAVPVRIRLEDVATPFDGEGCDCHTLTGDGITDLSLKFSKQQVVQMLALDGEPHFSYVELELAGQLQDGTDFAARDCVRVINP